LILLLCAKSEVGHLEENHCLFGYAHFGDVPMEGCRVYENLVDMVGRLMGKSIMRVAECRRCSSNGVLRADSRGQVTKI
jgi:hypothetical protein